MIVNLRLVLSADFALTVNPVKINKKINKRGFVVFMFNLLFCINLLWIGNSHVIDILQFFKKNFFQQVNILERKRGLI